MLPDNLSGISAIKDIRLVVTADVTDEDSLEDVMSKKFKIRRNPLKQINMEQTDINSIKTDMDETVDTTLLFLKSDKR